MSSVRVLVEGSSIAEMELERNPCHYCGTQTPSPPVDAAMQMTSTMNHNNQSTHSSIQEHSSLHLSVVL